MRRPRCRAGRCARAANAVFRCGSWTARTGRRRARATARCRNGSDGGRYAMVARSSTTPSSSASAIARTVASGLRRSCETHAMSSRREDSSARSRSRDASSFSETSCSSSARTVSSLGATDMDRGASSTSTSDRASAPTWRVLAPMSAPSCTAAPIATALAAMTTTIRAREVVAGDEHRLRCNHDAGNHREQCCHRDDERLHARADCPRNRRSTTAPSQNAAPTDAPRRRAAKSTMTSRAVMARTGNRRRGRYGDGAGLKGLARPSRAGGEHAR